MLMRQEKTVACTISWSVALWWEKNLSSSRQGNGNDKTELQILVLQGNQGKKSRSYIDTPAYQNLWRQRGIAGIYQYKYRLRKKKNGFFSGLCIQIYKTKPGCFAPWLYKKKWSTKLAKKRSSKFFSRKPFIPQSTAVISVRSTWTDWYAALVM